MAGSGGPVEFNVHRSAEEGTPLVAMAALDAGSRPSPNYARTGQPERPENRTVGRPERVDIALRKSVAVLADPR